MNSFRSHGNTTPVRRPGKEVRSMQEKNRENSQKEPNEQKNQKTDRK